MWNEKDDEVEQMVKQLPKHQLSTMESEQLWNKIEQNSKPKKGRRTKYFKPIVSLAAIFLLSILGYLIIENKIIDKSLSLEEKKMLEQSTLADSTLTDYQLALYDLYVTLPNLKETYEIDRDIVNKELMRVTVKNEEETMVFEELIKQNQVNLTIQVMNKNKGFNFEITEKRDRSKTIFLEDNAKTSVSFSEKMNVLASTLSSHLMSDKEIKLKFWFKDNKDNYNWNWEVGFIKNTEPEHELVTYSLAKDKKLGIHDVALLKTYVSLSDKKENYTITRRVEDNELIVSIEHKDFQGYDSIFREKWLDEDKIIVGKTEYAPYVGNYTVYTEVDYDQNTELFATNTENHNVYVVNNDTEFILLADNIIHVSTLIGDGEGKVLRIYYDLILHSTELRNKIWEDKSLTEVEKNEIYSQYSGLKGTEFRIHLD